jgi:hypothetical protein
LIDAQIVAGTRDTLNAGVAPACAIRFPPARQSAVVTPGAACAASS